jgi:lipid II:glycine glycyltransferase (peptidoglycan interpeptide bridge formation enzyme)
MSQQIRRDYKRSLREPIDVRFAERADVPSFHELYCKTASRQGVEPMALPYLYAMWDALRPRGWIQIAMANVDGVDVAGSAVTCFGDLITGRFLGFDPTRVPRGFRPNEALVWAIVEWARKHGYRWLDVGGLERDDAVMLSQGVTPPSRHKNQKVGMGGVAVLFPEPLELIRNPVLRTARRLLRGNAAGRALRKSFERRARTEGPESRNQ